MNKKAHGFTIVELLIVIVVIAILATISIVTYVGIQNRARDTQRKQDVASIARALEMYYVQYGEYPASSGCNSMLMIVGLSLGVDCLALQQAYQATRPQVVP
jgi:prepilin-type N-terminal cleavage/methylation domain-containing protein